MLFLSNRGGGISWRFDNEWRERENRVVVGCIAGLFGFG